MGILDRLKQHKDEALQNEGDRGLQKAGQMIDEKTSGQYSSQVNTGVNKAEQMLGMDPQRTQDTQGAQNDQLGGAPTDDTQEQPPTS